MTRDQIELRIRLMETKLAETTRPDDLATINRILERLIMMEAEDE